MFGGVATLRGEAASPRDDFRIAAVGPATSLVVAVGFSVVWVLVRLFGQPDLLLAVVSWLVSINVVLAVFNLVPGAPLDGGRILRAFLWSRSGDRFRAARSATLAGQAVAYGLVALGLVSFVSGDAVGGLWMVLIGWFLLNAARAEHDATVAGHLLRGVTVAQVMTPDVQTGRHDLNVDEFVSRLILGGRHSAYPVVGAHGEVSGLVTLDQLRQVPPSARATTSIADVALPLSAVTACAPGDQVAGLLERLTAESGRRALVFTDDTLVGIVTPADVARTLATRTLLADARS
jgi:CBS domain-containing protein